MGKIQYQQGFAGDESQIVDFANYVFSHAHRPHDFKTLLPKVYDGSKPFADLHYTAVDEHQNIKGLVCVLPVKFQIGESTVNVGLAGTVSVHPYAHGEGHMKQLMRLMRQDQQTKGTDILCLSGQRQRYGYFGYDYASTEIVFYVNRANIRHGSPEWMPEKFRFEEISDNANPLCEKCYELYEKQTIHGARPREAYLRYAHSWKCKLYAIMKENHFCGELLYTDWDEMPIREVLLYDENDLFPVLGAWLNDHTEVKEIPIPVWPYEKERIHLMVQYAEGWSVQPGEMIHILNFENTIRASMSLKEKYLSLEDGELTLEIGNERVKIQVLNGNSVCTKTAETPDCVFSPVEAQRKLYLASPDESETYRYKNWFPLPWVVPHPDRF